MTHTNGRPLIAMDARIPWAAGILEGEGSFLTKTGGVAPRVSCQMSDLDVLEGLRELFGGTIHLVRNPHPGSWKQTWTWGLASGRAATAMEMVRPYMMSRRAARIDELLEGWYALQERRLAERERRDLAGEAYRLGQGTLRELAARFGVSTETVRQRALRQLA